MTTPTVPGGPLTIDERMGSLSISGVNLCCVAWCVTDLALLWMLGDQRGKNRLLPEISGLEPYPHRFTETTHDLLIAIVGFVDRTGAPFPNPFVGLETNIDYLNANVVTPPGGTGGTRTAVLTKPSGATRSADVQVVKLDKDQQVGPVFLGRLRIIVPAGGFA